jgi:hypothetical protein
VSESATPSSASPSPEPPAGNPPAGDEAKTSAAGSATEVTAAAPSPAAPEPAAAKPAVAAKAKPPAPEEKPFGEFVPELLLPALAKEVAAYGGPAPELSFAQGPMPVVGSDCWMVKGALPGERFFWLCFTSADINAAKTIALAEGGGPPSLLEPFLSDEKKMSLPLLVSRVVQRLNGQKWLGPN